MRALMATLSEHNHDLLVAVDDALEIVWANARLESMLGYTIDALSGRSVDSLIHPEDRAFASEHMASFLVGEFLDIPTVLRVMHADGSWRWVEATAFEIPEGSRVASACIGLTIREVTTREESSRHRLAEQAWHEAALRRHHRRYRALLSHSSDAIVVIYPNGTIERINRKSGMFGQREPGDDEPDLFQFVHEGDKGWLRKHFAPLMDKPGSSITATFRAYDDQQQTHWIEATATNMLDNEDVVGYVVNYRDVTARVEAEQHAARLLEVLEETVDLIGICDPAGQLMHLNRAARTFAGVEGSLEGHVIPGNWLREEDHHILTDLLSQLHHHGSWSGELIVRDRNGEPTPVLGRMIAHRDPGGEVQFYSWILHDISDRKAVEDTLAHRASHDLLTELPNRSMLTEHIHSVGSRALRNGDQLAVLFVDLDRFKEVNDEWGHAEGDVVLRLIAARLRDAVRPADLIVRFGGDEFVVVLADLPGIEEAENVCRRILESLDRPLEVNGQSKTVGASIGIAMSSTDFDPEALVRRADRAMYQAKREGRGRYVAAKADDDL